MPEPGSPNLTVVAAEGLTPRLCTRNESVRCRGDGTAPPAGDGGDGGAPDDAAPHQRRPAQQRGPRKGVPGPGPSTRAPRADGPLIRRPPHLLT